MRVRSPDSVPCPPSRAFSLLELTLVVAIVAVLSAIALPRYAGSLERYQADAAARRLVADLAYAQRNARTTGTARTVRFDLAASTYTLVGVDDVDHPGQAYAVALSADPYHVTVASLAFDDPDDAGDALEEVVFDGYGAPDSDGTVVLQSGAALSTIVLDPDSGEATIQ